MIVYEGNITEEPTIKAWVRRAILDNGPLSLKRIQMALTFYEGKAVYRIVSAMTVDGEIYLDRGKYNLSGRTP